jgi:hypothetical protein
VPLAVKQAAAAVFFFVVGFLGNELLGKGIQKAEKVFTAVVGTAPEVPSGDLMSVEVERYETAEDAVGDNSPSWKPLVENWNEPGGHRFDVPVRDVSELATTVYAPQARAGYEDRFGELLGKGMDDVNLYVIHVPHSWSQDHLEEQFYKWADWCGVKRQWIPMWSSFRVRWLSRPRSECRPGGRCIILSQRCDRRIHTAVETGV